MNTLRYNEHLVQSLRAAIYHGGQNLSDIPLLVRRIVREGAWQKRAVTGTGKVQIFDRFADFVHTPVPEGLGCSIRTLQRLCADDPEALDALDHALQDDAQPGKRGNLFDNVKEVSGHQGGNDRAYALRRLRKDRPDLHTRVLAGELSPHAAMVEAGLRIRRPTIPRNVTQAASALARVFSQAELVELVAHLEELVASNRGRDDG